MGKEARFFLEAEFDTEGVLAKADKIMKLARELEEEAHNLRYKEKCGI